MFLLYSPLNQGLKLQKLVGLATGGIGFLLYSPLNQGLKLTTIDLVHILKRVFTLQSIKSRIETLLGVIGSHPAAVFLLYSPLNQGLKPRTAGRGRWRYGFYSTVH